MKLGSELDPGESVTIGAFLGLYDVLHQMVLGKEPPFLEEVEEIKD
jgi:hypothetical protein